MYHNPLEKVGKSSLTLAIGIIRDICVWEKAHNFKQEVALEKKRPRYKGWDVSSTVGRVKSG